LLERDWQAVKLMLLSHWCHDFGEASLMLAKHTYITGDSDTSEACITGIYYTGKVFCHCWIITGLTRYNLVIDIDAGTAFFIIEIDTCNAWSHYSYWQSTRIIE
jgi:hypothetical protein